MHTEAFGLSFDQMHDMAKKVHGDRLAVLREWDQAFDHMSKEEKKLVNTAYRTAIVVMSKVIEENNKAVLTDVKRLLGESAR